MPLFSVESSKGHCLLVDEDTGMYQTQRFWPGFQFVSLEYSSEFVFLQVFNVAFPFMWEWLSRGHP